MVLLLTCGFLPAALAQTAASSAQASIGYLRRVMDEYHDRFPVYDDVSSAGNHFLTYAKIPDGNASVTMNGSWAVNPHSGATAIRCEYVVSAASNCGGPNCGGFYMQNGILAGNDVKPVPNFGDVPNAGIDLTGATTLTFWARGERGGEMIEFFVAGVGWNPETGVPTTTHPDSSVRRPALGTIFGLTTTWTKYTIDLTGMNLSYVLGGFAWVADSNHNPNGAVFHLDDIQYELGPERRKKRLDEPRFLRSFSTLAVQPDPFDPNKNDDFDLVLRNLAFTYDNALALLALLADGTSDSIRRARLIGDALVYAATHDVEFNDNRTCGGAIDPLRPDGIRLRSAYAAGDIALPPGWTPRGRALTVPMPGFYAEATGTFYPVEQQAIDVGNNAWAAIALLALHGRTGAAGYLDVACKLANYIDSFRKTSGTFRGFTGGVQNAAESAPASLRPWASSEHNLDVHAAFTVLFELTGEPRWQSGAAHARQFVEAMWDEGRGCYLAGTTDPSTRNTTAGTLPLDVQAWSVLSLPDAISAHPGVLRCAERNHLNGHHGFNGFDFNEDRDGVWFEGSAQMTVAYQLAGQPASAVVYRRELRRAQQASDFGDREALAAACHDGVSTGFTTAGGDPFVYFRRLHVGATAWNVFAQTAYNPFYGTHASGRRRSVRQ